MAFTTFGSFQEIVGNRRRAGATGAIINSASFGPLTALGQIPITGITFNGLTASYTVIQNGTTLVSGQTASSYTATGLSNNTGYTYTLQGFTTGGVGGPIYTVTGGSGGTRRSTARTRPN